MDEKEYSGAERLDVRSERGTKRTERLKIDFTGNLAGFKQFKSCDDQVVSMIRSHDGPKVLVVVDWGIGYEDGKPCLVRDHLNLTGSNPLVGPNDPCGERFPAVNDVYVTDDILPDLPRAVAIGLKPGIVPNKQELTFLHSLGGQFCCFNLVPTMIVAAHAGWRVVAVVVPEKGKLDASIVQELTSG